MKKRCGGPCGLEKPADAFIVRRVCKPSQGAFLGPFLRVLVSRACRDCEIALQEAIGARRHAATVARNRAVAAKTCSDCGRERSTEKHFRWEKAKGNWRATCKDCDGRAGKIYRTTPGHEKYLERSASSRLVARDRWRTRHPGREREIDRESTARYRDKFTPEEFRARRRRSHALRAAIKAGRAARQTTCHMCPPGAPVSRIVAHFGVVLVQWVCPRHAYVLRRSAARRLREDYDGLVVPADEWRRMHAEHLAELARAPVKTSPDPEREAKAAAHLHKFRELVRHQEYRPQRHADRMLLDALIGGGTRDD